MSNKSPPSTVGELRQSFSSFCQKTVNNWLDGRFSDYIKHARPIHKEIHEEWIAILAFLRHFRVSDDERICLGQKSQQWDARVGDSLFIEVSRAAPDDDHVYRRMLADGGYRTIADQYLHAISLKKVPDIIVERIKKKLLKKYPKGTVLLISVSGDATYEDDDVVQGWLPKIRRSVKLGSFSEIYIVEEARSKLFKIF